MTSEDENRQRQMSNCWPLSFTSAFAVVCCTLSETDVSLVLTTMQTFNSSTAVVLLGFSFMYPWKVHRKAGSNKCAHSSINRPWAALRPHFSLFWNLLVYFDVSFYECHLHLHYKKNVAHKMWRRCDNKFTLIKEKTNAMKRMKDRNELKWHVLTFSHCKKTKTIGRGDVGISLANSKQQTLVDNFLVTVIIFDL